VPKKSKLDKIVELIQQGKSSAVVKELPYIKRACKLAKELTMEYPLSKDELFYRQLLNKAGTSSTWSQRGAAASCTGSSLESPV
jgi:hypothetical protein